MPKITIDNIEYNTEDLTENGKAQLASAVPRSTNEQTKV